MKLITCVAVAIMLFAVAVQAAEVPMSAGDKAMVFSFNGLDNLDLDGYGHDYGFGMRYYLSDGMALRGGVVFGMNTWTDESGEEDFETTENSLGVEAIYEMHMEGPCPSVAPFLGVGGNWMSYSWENDADDKYEESMFGVFGVAGFEWGFADCMTLGGEYRLGFSSGSYEESEDGEVYDEGSVTMIGFDTVSVMLSVYW
jgi:hypothetical protein